MNTSFLKTLTASLACICLAGLSDSASAQFFDNLSLTAPTNQLLAPQYNDTYSRQLPLQWQDRLRNDQRMDQRYIRTNTTDATMPQGEYRSRQGRCADGQCQRNRGERSVEDGTASYRGRRSRGEGYANGRDFQSRRAMTTGWDPSNPEAIDPATGLPMEHSYRGRHNHPDGEGHRGRCRDCVNGQCDCPEGQCTCPAGQHDCKDGQCRHRQLVPRNAPTGYDDLNLTRRNMSPQYMPTRSPYLN